LSIQFESVVVGPIETNCYILWDRDTLSAAIIDPGGDIELITRIVDSNALRVERILLTHGHFDHTFCAGELARLYGARVGIHGSDIWLMDEGLGIATMYYDMSKLVEVTPDDLLQDGDVIVLAGSQLKVLHTPGHSTGGLCFVTDAGVFCGDTIFAGTVGRTDFPGGSFETLISSIKSKLLTLDDSTPLYPGHDAATTVGEERRSNPYLS
jgi:hydroxyacylglutathione hydrolase